MMIIISHGAYPMDNKKYSNIDTRWPTSTVFFCGGARLGRYCDEMSEMSFHAKLMDVLTQTITDAEVQLRAMPKDL